MVEGPQERYQLNWPGQREALLTANAPIALIDFGSRRFICPVICELNSIHWLIIRWWFMAGWQDDIVPILLPVSYPAFFARCAYACSMLWRLLKYYHHVA